MRANHDWAPLSRRIRMGPLIHLVEAGRPSVTDVMTEACAEDGHSREEPRSGDAGTVHRLMQGVTR